MNIEEQLRDHFEDEAAGLTIPAGSFDDVRRRGRRRRVVSAAGGAALALVLVGGVGLGVKLVGDNQERAPTDSIAAAATDQTRSDLAAATPENELGGYAPGPGTPLGSIDFTWSEVATLIPGGTEGWINGMNANEWGVVVFGAVTNPEDGTTTPLIWTSVDGSNWVAADPIPALGPNDYLNQVTPGPLGYLGLATGYDESTGRQTALLVRSSDGRSWTVSSLPSTVDAELAYVPASVAMSTDGVVVSGSIQNVSSGPPVVIRKDGKTLTITESAGALNIVDDATGTVLYTGTADDIWKGTGDTAGMAVYDPATGDLLMEIPYDVWDEAIRNYLPGPYEDGSTVTVAPARPSGSAVEPTGTVVVEQDGKRLTLEQGRFRVEDVANGALLGEGTESDLFRGPGPRFVDPATGEMILSITWDEYDQAQQTAYDNYEWPQPTPVMYFSPDGTAWEQVFSGTEGTWVNTVAAGPAGFLATGATDDGRTVVWRSVDGRTWEEAAASFEGAAPQWVGAIYPTAGGYLAQADDGIWSSPDGLTWTRVFTAGLYDDKTLSVNSVASGTFGIVLNGSMHAYTEPQPMVITKEGKTLTIDPLKGSVVITDENGVVFDRTFDAASTAAPDWVQENGDGFAILDPNGDVIMSVTSADLSATVTTDAGVDSPPENLLVFSSDGATWNRVGGIDLGNTWVQAMGVTDRGVLILTQDESTVYSDGGIASTQAIEGQPSVRLMFGTPTG